MVDPRRLPWIAARNDSVKPVLEVAHGSAYGEDKNSVAYSTHCVYFHYGFCIGLMASM